MSLYYDAASLLGSGQSGSLKSRVFGARNLKSPPTQVFALLTEASKWSEILAEIIEKSLLLQQEKKVITTLFSTAEIKSDRLLSIVHSSLLRLQYSWFMISCCQRKVLPLLLLTLCEWLFLDIRLDFLPNSPKRD